MVVLPHDPRLLHEGLPLFLAAVPQTALHRHLLRLVPGLDVEEALVDLAEGPLAELLLELDLVVEELPLGPGRALDDDARAMWLETESTLRAQKALIDSLDVDQSEKDKMHLVIPPASDDEVGVPLDKGVYEMLVSKQKGFTEEQDTIRRNELKNRIVRLGAICQIAHNNIHQPHGKYDALEVHFRRMFSNIKYSVADMMNQITNQEDLTEV